MPTFMQLVSGRIFENSGNIQSIIRILFSKSNENVVIYINLALRKGDLDLTLGSRIIGLQNVHSQLEIMNICHKYCTHYVFVMVGPL